MPLLLLLVAGLQCEPPKALPLLLVVRPRSVPLLLLLVAGLQCEPPKAFPLLPVVRPRWVPSLLLLLVVRLKCVPSLPWLLVVRLRWVHLLPLLLVVKLSWGPSLLVLLVVRLRWVHPLLLLRLLIHHSNHCSTSGCSGDRSSWHDSSPLPLNITQYDTDNNTYKSDHKQRPTNEKYNRKHSSHCTICRVHFRLWRI